jgi:hypothetical protein
MNPSCCQAIAVVKHLRLEGVSIWADQQGDIHVSPMILTPEDRALVIAHKPAVVAWLRAYAVEHCPSIDELRRRGWLNGERTT